MNNLIKVYVGTKMILKKYCPYCKAEAIIIDGKFTCCDREAFIEDSEKAKKLRLIETSNGRIKPPKKIQNEILSHQNHQCIYCGTALMRKKIKIHFDHFYPFIYSQDNKLNFVASCSKCNLIKGSHCFNSIQEARIYIQSQREIKKLPVFEYYGRTFEVRKV